jgi:16S rRNA (uracil1498-N3)-methyltransferase
MNIFYAPDIENKIYFLSAEESIHCCGSLRMKVGAKLHLADGLGNLYEAHIVTASSKKCEFDKPQLLTSNKANSPWIHLCIAPTKNMDRIEWLVEKAGEIGVDEISFMSCRNSERKVLKTERLEKKAVSAMKQSKNLFKMKINELEAFKLFIKRDFDNCSKSIAVVESELPHFKDQVASNSSKDVLLLIGPEGDFTSEETKFAQENGYVKVGLGTSVLRTETAGLLGSYCAVLALRN